MDVTQAVHVVEDDEDVRSSLKALLTASGFSVYSFASAESFLAEQDGLAPGVLVVDCRMPGCGGISLLKRLQPRFLPIVHSAHLDEDTTAEARRLGAFDTVEKPACPASLLDIVRSASAFIRHLR